VGAKWYSHYLCVLYFDDTKIFIEMYFKSESKARQRKNKTVSSHQFLPNYPSKQNNKMVRQAHWVGSTGCHKTVRRIRQALGGFDRLPPPRLRLGKCISADGLRIPLFYSDGVLCMGRYYFPRNGWICWVESAKKQNKEPPDRADANGLIECLSLVVGLVASIVETNLLSSLRLGILDLPFDI
jgi:hypothetical protein